MNSKAHAVVDLVQENNKLREDNYKDKRDKAGMYLMISIVEFLMIVFLIWLVFFYFPKTKFAWTSNAGAVCAMTPIDQPNIHQAIAADFAKDAVLSLYTYDYINYRTQITDATNRWFTDDFRNAFMPMFADSKTLKAAIENTNIVSSQGDGPVQLVRVKGGKGEAFSWEFQVPFQVFYTVGKKPPRAENMVATVTVTRVTPSPHNPSGIAVSNVVADHRIR